MPTNSSCCWHLCGLSRLVAITTCSLTSLVLCRPWFVVSCTCGFWLVVMTTRCRDWLWLVDNARRCLHVLVNLRLAGLRGRGTREQRPLLFQQRPATQVLFYHNWTVTFMLWPNNLLTCSSCSPFYKAIDMMNFLWSEMFSEICGLSKEVLPCSAELWFNYTWDL